MRNNVLLVIHDHQDPDLYKKLQHGYHVSVARSWEKVQQVLDKISIQLIISSVEFCARFKSRSPHAHIPVIAIARDNSLQSKLKSLEAGADAFIGNPVPWVYLDAQIRNLVINRAKVADFFSLTHAAENNSPESNNDEDLIKKLNDLIGVHMQNRLLNVDLLARSMNMSRATLYRKVKTITGITPNELINRARLKKAAERLGSGNYKVFEIARMAGFQTQSSFGKAFIKQFKVTPTQYLQMKKKSSLQSRNPLAEKYPLQISIHSNKRA